MRLRIIAALGLLFALGSVGDGAIGGGSIRPHGGGAINPTNGTVSSGVDPIFHLALDNSGVGELPTTISVQSQTLTLTYAYAGGDAASGSPGTWTANTGSNLTEAGGGTSPNYGFPSPFQDTTSVDFVASNYFETAATGDVALGTSDVVFFTIYRPEAASDTIWSQYTAGGYYELTIDASNQTVFTAYDGTTTCTITGDAVNLGEYNFVAVYLDRSYRGGMYTNGGTVDQCVAAVTGTLSVAADFTIGARTGGATPLDGQVALVAIYTAAGGTLTNNLSGGQDVDLWHKLAGIWPDTANGTTAPSIVTRSSSAVVWAHDTVNDKITMARVASGWPRLVSWPVGGWGGDPTGATSITGYLSELPATNLMLQSEDLATTWTNIASSGETVNAIAAPDGVSSADAVDGSGTGEQGVTQTVTLTAASYTLSTFAKAGGQSFAYLDTDIANADGYFNLSSCSTGTIGSAATGFAEDWGNGWCRISIKFTGTAAGHVLDLQCADADASNSYAGASADCYFWGAQVEAGAYASSYIATTTGSVTRSADRLRFVGNDGNTEGGAGALRVQFMTPNYVNGTGQIWWLYESGTDQITTSLNASSGALQVAHFDGAYQFTQNNGSTDSTDGTHNYFELTWDTNDVDIDLDGQTYTDTTANNPADAFANIEVGVRETGAVQIHGMVTCGVIYGDKESPAECQ